jgi:hypothetical protein
MGRSDWVLEEIADAEVGRCGDAIYWNIVCIRSAIG